MLRRKVALVALLTALAPVGCGAQMHESLAPASPGYASVEAAAQPAGAPLSGDPAGRIDAPQPGMPGSGAAKAKEVASDKTKGDAFRANDLIVFTGTIAMLVEEAAIATTIDAASDAAASLGGYVQKQDGHSVTVRVPSARFRDAMRELEKLGQVEDRSVTAQDVTEEAHDLEVRLKSLFATRKRLEEFLQRANNIAEVLSVEEQLARVSTEIDRIEGRMRFLQAQAAMSTITLALRPIPRPTLVEQPAPPPPPPPPARTLPLPSGWLSTLGVDRLLQLSE